MISINYCTSEIQYITQVPRTFQKKSNEELYRIHCENVLSLRVNLGYTSRFIWEQEQQSNYEVPERYEYSVNFSPTIYNFIYSTENRLFLRGQSPTSYSPNFCKLSYKL